MKYFSLRQKYANWNDPMYEKPSLVIHGSSGKPVKSKQKFSNGMQRRANYVSEVLFDDIVQIVNSGELGATATVTQVKVIPNMAHMNIYWECTGDQEKDDQTQMALAEKASQLRHKLIVAQTLGSVPMPVFVKDFTVSRQRTVEEILHQISLEVSAEAAGMESASDTSANDTHNAETGSDTHNAPDIDSATHNASDIDSDLDVPSEQKLTDIDGNLDGNIVRNDKDSFKQDVYGLQHDVLMKKVVSAKTSAIQRPSIVSYTKNEDNLSQFNLRVKTKFLNKKEISKKKVLRELESMDDRDFRRGKVMSESVELKDDFDNEEYSAIDEYIEKYSKEKIKD